MALFGRESDETTTDSRSPLPVRQPSPSANKRTTLIASGAKLIGEISGDTDVMIEGTVEGKVHPAQDVIVGEKGVVRGEIDAQSVRIAGKVMGNVRGKKSVEILATGSLEGDVSSPSMVIGDGAFFKGRVEMTGGRQPEPQQQKKQKKQHEHKGPGETGSMTATPSPSQG